VQVCRRIDVVELRGLDDGVERGGDLGAAPRLRAEVIAAADDRPANSSLGGIVVERDRPWIAGATAPNPLRVISKSVSAHDGRRDLPNVRRGCGGSSCQENA
jgi:hypothetical protein